MLNIVWLKRDLRLADHAPLFEASKDALKNQYDLLFLYVIEDEYWNLEEHSFRHWEFIKDSLAELQQKLRSIYQQDLMIMRGDIVECFSQLHTQHNINAVHSHEETGIDWTYKRDLRVAKFFREIGVQWHEHPNGGVIRRLKTRDEWKKLQEIRLIKSCIPEPDCLAQPPKINFSNTLLNTFTLPRYNVNEVQRGGRDAAISTLLSFLGKRSRTYQKSISKPAQARESCSRLSPHLSFGTLSIREVMQSTWSTMRDAKDNGDWVLRRNLAAFQSRLHWHCHFIQKLEDQPQIEFKCMHSAFEGMREPHHDDTKLDAWRNGRTGFPFVDACMRSLIQTGYLNFRMRAMLVSFAAYHLFLDWRKLNPILASLFTDYEPGIHISQLQMQSGVTGINTLRIYNPVKQGLDHDPKGNFIREFVPELNHLSNDDIHLPNNIYTEPLVELKTSLSSAREAISNVRRSEGFRTIAKGVYDKLGSRKRSDKPKSNSQPNLLTRKQVTKLKNKK